MKESYGEGLASRPGLESCADSCETVREALTEVHVGQVLSRAKFSDTFGFSLDAIKHWEGGRRTPEAPARTLLTVIDKNPAAVLTALNPAAFAAVSSSERTTVHVSRHRKPQASRGRAKRNVYSAGRKRITK